MPRSDGEKLWRYADLARLWAWALIGAAVALLALSVGMQAGTGDGLSLWWFAAAFGITGVTGIVLYPLFRSWRSAMPSMRLPDAVRATGARRLEASPRDWRMWAITTGIIVFLGCAVMMVFLVAVLKPGGTVEGVVVGMMAAWGAATLDDVRRIRRAEQAEGRRYYAACRRPTGVGNHLVWTRPPKEA